MMDRHDGQRMMPYDGLLDRTQQHLVGSMMIARGALLAVPMKAWLECELKMRSSDAVLMGVYP